MTIFFELTYLNFIKTFYKPASSPSKANDPPPADLEYYDEYYGEEGGEPGNIDDLIEQLNGENAMEGEYEYADEAEGEVEPLEEDY